MQIFKSMAGIMKEIEAIKKGKTNKQGEGFKYRGIDDVMNSLHEAFAKHGVFITTEVLNRVEKERQSNAGKPLFYVTNTIKFTFHAEDGSNVSSTVYGTAMDSGDKADNKSLSIGLKYALLQAFLVPTEDMVDPDAETHDVKPAAKPPVPADKFEKLVKYCTEEPDKVKVADAVKKYVTAFTFTEEQLSKIKEAQ